MKIVIYSHTWWPKVGGVEDIGHLLANGLAKRGHSVTVITPTTPTPPSTSRPADQTPPLCQYQLLRSPSRQEIEQAVKEADIVHSNGIAMKLMPLALRHGKPFTWAHHGYQLQCIDGAGWAQGRPAPMQPWQSIVHHIRLFGVRAGTIGGAKLWVRRLASCLVTRNITISHHLATRQPAARLVMIHNPYDPDVFGCPSQEQAAERLKSATSTFTFIGRLVTEKGVDDLLHAFASLKASEAGSEATLTVVGDGPEKTSLQSLAKALGAAARITWLNSTTGDPLKRLIEHSGICVIPSAWEEPGALMVLNSLAAGKPLIVSQRGWLSEAAEEACLTFPNGDRAKLASAMDRLWKDQNLQVQLSARALEQIHKYKPDDSIDKYADLFLSLTHRKGQA